METTWATKEIRNWIAKQFDQEHAGQTALHFTLSEIKDGVSKDNGSRFRMGVIGEALKELGIEPGFYAITRQGKKKPEKQRWYQFERIHFVPVRDAEPPPPTELQLAHMKVDELQATVADLQQQRSFNWRRITALEERLKVMLDTIRDLTNLPTN